MKKSTWIIDMKTRLFALQLSSILLLVLFGCEAPPVPSYAPPSSEVPGAPDVPKLSVLRPYFQTSIGNIDAGSAAGTAFAVKLDDQSEPIVLTALSVLGTGSGLSRNAVSTELNEILKSITLGDAFGSFDGVIQAKDFIQIPDSAMNGQSSVAGDVLAIRLDQAAARRLGTFRVSNVETAPGDKAWLSIAAFVGAMPSQRQHAATITGMDDQGNICYKFENPKLSMQGSLGAPLLNDDGAVIAIHLGGSLNDGSLSGFGNPLSRFLPSLRDSAVAGFNAPSN